MLDTGISPFLALNLNLFDKIHIFRVKSEHFQCCEMKFYNLHTFSFIFRTPNTRMCPWMDRISEPELLTWFFTVRNRKADLFGSVNLWIKCLNKLYPTNFFDIKGDQANFYFLRKLFSFKLNKKHIGEYWKPKS